MIESKLYMTSMWVFMEVSLPSMTDPEQEHLFSKLFFCGFVWVTPSDSFSYRLKSIENFVYDLTSLPMYVAFSNATRRGGLENIVTIHNRVLKYSLLVLERRGDYDE
jgi:hypothetical protein